MMLWCLLHPWLSWWLAILVSGFFFNGVSWIIVTRIKREVAAPEPASLQSMRDAFIGAMRIRGERQVAWLNSDYQFRVELLDPSSTDIASIITKKTTPRE